MHLLKWFLPIFENIFCNTGQQIVVFVNFSHLKITTYTVSQTHACTHVLLLHVYTHAYVVAI